MFHASDRPNVFFQQLIALVSVHGATGDFSSRKSRESVRLGQTTGEDACHLIAFHILHHFPGGLYINVYLMRFVKPVAGVDLTFVCRRILRLLK